MVEAAIGSSQRNAADVEHRQHVGVGELILKRKPNYVEVRERRKALYRQQRQAALPQACLHVGPRSIDPFCLPTRMFVEQAIEDLQSKMAHSDLVGVRKA